MRQRLRLLNLVLGVAVLAASIYPVGLDLLFWLFSPGALRAAFGATPTMLLAFVCKFALPAALLYALARRFRLERYFNLRVPGRRLVLLGNLLALTLALPDLYGIGEPISAATVDVAYGSALFHAGAFVLAMAALVTGLVRIAAAQSLPKRLLRKSRI